LAALSSPQTTIVVGSGSGPGSVINAAVTVLRGLATRACGKASWICSPSESVSATKRVGGMPA
jgi:hypothetical protein